MTPHEHASDDALVSWLVRSSRRFALMRRIAARPLLTVAEGLDWLADRIHRIYLRAAG